MGYPTTAQGMFNRVWNHFVVGKAKRGVEYKVAETCAYRGDNGTKCAVGALVSDAECRGPDGHFVNGSVRDLVLDRKLPSRLRPHLSLLEDLQAAHDGPWFVRIRDRRKALRAIAKKHGLTVPASRPRVWHSVAPLWQA